MDHEHINIIFIMENQEPTTIKVSNQMKVQALLSMLKKNCVEKQNVNYGYEKYFTSILKDHGNYQKIKCSKCVKS